MTRSETLRGLRSTLFLGLVLALAAWPAIAQTDLSAEPGFVDFGGNAFFAEEDLDVHISVKDPMIQLVAAASRDSDPELADVLSPLKAVDVYVYKVGDNRNDDVSEEISRQAKELSGSGWSEAITIRTRAARGHVFLRMAESTAVGVAALYLDETASEAVYLNIVGAIDPLEIGRLAAKFNLDPLSEAVKRQMPPTE